MSERKYTYEYPRPALTADCVIFGFDGESLKILLVERGLEPYKGCWALPGGFMKMDETIDECARRELLEETGVRDVYVEQFGCFSGVGRDPRGRVVTVAFIALVRPADHQVRGGDDARLAAWFDASDLPPLAFDHKEIIAAARRRLREILVLRPVAFRLLDETFTVDELRKVYETVNNTTYDRRNFHRKLMQSDIVEAVDDDASICISSSNMPGKTPERGRRPRLFRLGESLRTLSAPDNPSVAADEDKREDGSMKDLFLF
ncbi:MAG: NUDIX hydrolase [Muribaculaceae bacterium]|nr:NUDIX hydrolase [Muribaculaceae bacterium]